MTNIAANMNFLPLVGRVLLGILFLLSGINKLMGPGGTAGFIASKGLPMADVLVWIVIAVEIVGGLMLITGYKSWLAALGLVVFTLAATVIFHNFWALEGQAKTIQQILFMKNLAIIGGLLLLAHFGPGSMSLDRKT